MATCTLLLELGYPVYFYDGAETNFKITTLDDVEMFKALLNVEQNSWQKHPGIHGANGSRGK